MKMLASCFSLSQKFHITYLCCRILNYRRVTTRASTAFGGVVGGVPQSLRLTCASREWFGCARFILSRVRGRTSVLRRTSAPRDKVYEIEAALAHADEPFV